MKTLQITWPVVHKVLEEEREVYKKYARKKRAPQKDFKVVNKVYLFTKFL